MEKDSQSTVRCPRCGGLMYKPAGSSLYWHADNNHPRCSITNIFLAEPAKDSVNISSAVSDEHPGEPQQP